MDYENYYDFKDFDGENNPYPKLDSNHAKILTEFLGNWITENDWNDILNKNKSKFDFFSKTTQEVMKKYSTSKSNVNTRHYFTQLNSFIRNSKFRFERIERSNPAMEHHFLVKSE